MKEIGGYIELDTYTGNEYHTDCLALNCGRNCLAYLISAKKIKKIQLPYFLCASVMQTCRQYGVEVRYYHIDERFQPMLQVDLDEEEYLYLVNYYGQIGNEALNEYAKKYKRLIIDNAQAFFQMPLREEGVDTIYTCRKYFGVADGAYLYTDVELEREIITDTSFSRINFLLGRYERTASEFYREYVDNNCFFETEDIKYMSKLTHNMLRALDYQQICIKREENYIYMHRRFGGNNILDLKIPKGPFMYPLYVKNDGEYIRKKLQSKKIYIPMLWPDVLQISKEGDLEYDIAKNILPIPVDQRYTVNHMKYIADMIDDITDNITHN